MKKIITGVLVMLFAICTLESKAQTWNEWFRQKKTQKEYLVQQIAALQVYIGYAKKGYDIVNDGLKTVSGNTGTELNLHTDHFNSLSMVNPEIRQDPKVTEIMVMRNRIIYDYHTTYQQLLSSGVMSKDEIEYVRLVYNRLLADCQYNVDQLQKVSTDNILDMTDAERMERIDKLYEDMKDKYAFSRSFSNDAKGIAISRIKEKKEIKTSRDLYGIKSR